MRGTMRLKIKQGGRPVVAVVSDIANKRIPGPSAASSRRTKPSRIEDVRTAVSDFLKQQPDVRRVNVTKLVQIDPEAGSWEVEAELYVPNTTIRNLGLPVSKEVLDCRQYLLRVDGQLNIIAYGLRDLVEERT